VIPDPISEIVALLQADDDVSALTAGLVFGGGLPVNARADMPQPAVVVTAAGGPGRRGYNRYRRTRVDTTCYGQTLKESWDLHLAVRELLEGLGRTGSIFWAQTISDGANGIDRVEQWPTCFASYLVMSAAAADA
jgi:hypothetical protein